MRMEHGVRRNVVVYRIQLMEQQVYRETIIEWLKIAKVGQNKIHHSRKSSDPIWQSVRKAFWHVDHKHNSYLGS